MVRIGAIPSVLLLLSRGARAMFSVHDDILAFPQYEIKLRSEILTEEEADTLLSSAPTSSVARPSTATATATATAVSSSPEEKGGGEEAETYEALWMRGRRYLCSVPVVQSAAPMTATEKELTRAAEEKELARATTRGWELLSDLEGRCLYFVSGWWSYSYCHDREVRQFHQRPVGSGEQVWPPDEDPDTPSYVLGRVGDVGGGGGGDGRELQLQATGELRFLVQKVGGGTTCDLTGKERKIEVQFHCNSQGSDRIGWIKEVSICCYLMVVYTPRLCNDVAFLPPREDRVNGVSCRPVMDREQLARYVEGLGGAEAGAEVGLGGGGGGGDGKETDEVKTLGGVVLRGGGNAYYDDDIELLMHQDL